MTNRIRTTPSSTWPAATAPSPAPSAMGPIRGLMYSVRSRPDFLNAIVALSELTTITAAEDATATCIGSMTSGRSVDAA